MGIRGKDLERLSEVQPARRSIGVYVRLAVWRSSRLNYDLAFALLTPYYSAAFGAAIK
jgi:hypothetical protein